MSLEWGDSTRMASHCNLTGWKDLKQKITDMAGNSHQRVAWLSDCAADGSSNGRSITADAVEGGFLLLLLLSISTISERNISACSVSLVNQAYHQVRKQGNPSLYNSRPTDRLHCLHSVAEHRQCKMYRMISPQLMTNFSLSNWNWNTYLLNIWTLCALVMHY